MKNYLDRMNFENLLSPPQNDVIRMLQSRPVLLIGKDLMRRNVEDEVHRLQFNDEIIDPITNEIWNSHLTARQKRTFVRLANNINIIRNSDNVDRISRINTPQITKNDFENDFFNGTNFYGDKSFQSLILPSDGSCGSCLGTSLFPQVD
ncbi:hypothetical protein GLOIN_2v1773585 [Rhizophagus clarus]|uniref:Uncharacterized protein n=1 Tax=Rhizophagus clarus TaxID=94130 RepID=A0A8H3LZU7_9GLOM|nr:hypothetical protein GLOIN_2v1773585 [Rhizophagus clarus]